MTRVMVRLGTLRGGLAPVAGVILLLVAALVLTQLQTTLALFVLVSLVLFITLLRFPELAVYLLIFAIPFGSLMPLSLAGANVTAADGLLFLALLLWLARQIARRQILIRKASLLVPFLVFLLAASISVTGALSLQAAGKELLKWIEMLAIYWLIVQDLTPRQVTLSLFAIFLAGAAEAALGIYQYIFRVGPEGFLLFGGSNLRAFGTFEQPNPYAGYLGLIIPLAFGTALGIVFMRSRKEAAGRIPLLLVALISLAAMLAALYFSLSRGAWLSVAAALAMTFVIRSKRAATFGLLAGVLLFVILLLGQLDVIPDVVTERFSGIADYFTIQDVRGVKANDENFAIVERLAHWQAAIGMFNDHPGLGIGIGNYAEVYPAYALPHWDDPLGHAHNYYLNVLAESGLLGFCGYLVLWGAIFWMGWSTVRSARGFQQGIAAGAFGVLVALSIHNLFDNLFVHSMQMQVGITLGLLETLRSRAAL